MKQPVILLGPTGVGKTSVSLLLARHLRTEIISADSMQIYRSMDIGTAKPSPEQRGMVPHHMIDIVDPWASYSAGAYVSRAEPLVDRLIAAGIPPLIVGGTGLYIKALTRGIFKGPSADWDLRESLFQQEAAAPGSLHKRLRKLDATAASKIMIRDLRRIVRAIEVCLKGDAAISELHRTATVPLPYTFVKIGLTRDRRELYPMIENRVDKMVKDGLVREVERVLAMIQEHCPTPYQPLPSMQAIGYKEIAAYFSGNTSLDEAIHLIKKRSKGYAKRQYTWFRREDGIRWVEVTGMFQPDEMLQRVLHVLRK